MTPDDRSLTPSPIPRVTPGRAYTLEEKRAIIECLLETWAEASSLRLGQLFVCACPGKNLFYVEDHDLFDLLNEFRTRVRP